MTTLKIGRPTGGESGTAFAQWLRDNFAALREQIACLGSAPGFDFSHNGGSSATPSELYYREQTAVAAGDDPSRNSAQRTWVRITMTYSGSVVTKMKFEISVNSGSTYSNWVDAAGNYFYNLDYTGRAIPFGTWATS